MHTFFPSRKSKSSFILKGDELKHLRVRRIRKGEKVGAIWEGEIYLCELEKINRKEARLKVIEKIESKRPSVEVTLLQAVPVEIKTFETILQKSTELGVSVVVPLITERSFRDRKIFERKRERWERIIKEAMKQARRPYMLELRDPVPLRDLESLSELNIVLDNFSEGKSIKEMDLRGVKSVSLAVGPEGGFSISEVEKFKEKGFVSVRLEPHVLRSDTAAVVGVGLIVNLAGP